MNEKFTIKSAALYVLEKIYLESDHRFHANISMNDLINNDYDRNTIIKAVRYLSEKKYIGDNKIPDKNIDTEITALGIDWVEDCHNINPVSN